MIDGNLKEGYELICDICGYMVTGFDDFDEAKEYAEDNKWSREFTLGVWENYCPECQEV